MKVCIVSDSHDRADSLHRAASAARDEGAVALVHCGDLIGAHTLGGVFGLGLAMHVVHGNNLGDTIALGRLAADSNGKLRYHGGEADIVLGERRVFVTHYPHLARGMACTGDYELVCCGHSHKASVSEQPNVQGGHTWLVNPGTVAGIGAAPTWVLGDLARMSFQLRTLSPS